MTLASVILGYSGLGFGLICMTAFSFLPFNLERITAMLTIVIIILCFILLLLSYKRFKIDWGKIGLISIGLTFGVPLGYFYILKYHASPIFKFSLGLIILFVSLFSLLPSCFKGKIHSNFAVLFGAISGFLGGAFITGGPVLTLYMYSQVEDPRDMKSTLQAIFIIGNTIRLITIGVGNIGYTKDVIIISSIVLIPVLLMLYFGHVLSEKFRVVIIRKTIYGFICFFGILITINGLNDMI